MTFSGVVGDLNLENQKVTLKKLVPEIELISGNAFGVVSEWESIP